MSAAVVLILRTLFSISLFAFLGWVIFTLWKNLQQTIKDSSDYDIKPISILVMDSERSYISSQPEFFVGRDPQADLHIPDDTLSAIHARIYYKNDQWMIEDLQSTNGTFLNDERLSTPSVIIAGDEVACGQIRLQVDIK